MYRYVCKKDRVCQHPVVKSSTTKDKYSSIQFTNAREWNDNDSGQQQIGTWEKGWKANGTKTANCGNWIKPAIFWAVALKGTKSCITQGDFCLFVRLSIHPFPSPWSGLSGFKSGLSGLQLDFSRFKWAFSDLKSGIQASNQLSQASNQSSQASNQSFQALIQLSQASNQFFQTLNQPSQASNQPSHASN